MSSKEHTPGPWTFNRSSTGNGATIYAGAANPIARIRECSCANGAVLAAAPEMLEALRSTERWFKTWSVEIGAAEEALFETIRAALAKATGAQS